jgi:NAD(P)-dependent dehydrogenase (short-subunit alcohol dehydrogenase family)
LEVPFVKDNNFSIDVLYNVAGTASGGEKTATQVTAAGLRADIDSNYIGTVLTTLAFLPLLQSSPTKAPAKVIYMSTLMASHSLVSTLGDFAGAMPGYSASKSAGNMWFQKLALEITGGALAREGGWIITMLHPGLVETDMGKGLGGVSSSLACRPFLHERGSIGYDLTVFIPYNNRLKWT